MRKFREILAQRHNVRAHFWQSCANYIQQISGLVLGIVLARLLSPEAFGEFAYTTSVVGLFLLPASWSLAPQIVSEIRANPSIASDALWFSRRIVLTRAALAVGACVFLAWTLGKTSALLGAIIALPQVGGELVAVLRATLEGRGQFKVNFYDSLLSAGCTGLLGLPAAWLGAGTWALAVPCIPLFVAQLWLFSACSGSSLVPAAPRSDRKYIRSGFTLWLASLGEGALFRADKIFLGKFSSLSGLGDYNRAFNYAPLSARVLNSLLTNPTVAGLTHAADSRSRFRIVTKSASLLMAGGLLNFAILWWFSAPLVPWIFGLQWTAAVPVFQAMAPLSLVISFAYLPTAVALAEHAYTHLAAARMLSLISFLVCAVWLGPQLDAVKVAWLLQATLVLQGTLLIVWRIMR